MPVNIPCCLVWTLQAAVFLLTVVAAVAPLHRRNLRQVDPSGNTQRDITTAMGDFISSENVTITLKLSEASEGLVSSSSSTTENQREATKLAESVNLTRSLQENRVVTNTSDLLECHNQLMLLYEGEFTILENGTLMVLHGEQEEEDYQVQLYHHYQLTHAGVWACWEYGVRGIMCSVSFLLCFVFIIFLFAFAPRCLPEITKSKRVLYLPVLSLFLLLSMCLAYLTIGPWVAVSQKIMYQSPVLLFIITLYLTPIFMAVLYCTVSLLCIDIQCGGILSSIQSFFKGILSGIQSFFSGILPGIQ